MQQILCYFLQQAANFVFENISGRNYFDLQP